MHAQLRGSRHLRALLTVAAGLIVTATCLLPARSDALTLETELVREYTAPAGFSLDGLLARGAGAKTALAGNFAPPDQEMPTPACYIIVADAEGASGFPIRYQQRPTACSGLAPRPGGGFFLRGIRETESDTPTGFTMKLNANGDIQWTTDDTAIAETEDFRGNYAQPAPVMAYNPRSQYLLAFTFGQLNIEGQTRPVTHASVLRNDSGAFQTKVIRLGASQGFGRVGGVEPLSDSGDFLVFLRDTTTNGAYFYRYDGRQQVDDFQPRGEGWARRQVVQMQAGPDGLVYIVWVDAEAQTPNTKVTAVTSSGAEVWSGSYLPRASESCSSTQLGPPRGMWVGAENLVVLYSGSLRVIDSGNGDTLGVVSLSGATGDGFQPFDILKGEGGNLKLLAVKSGESQATFRELALNFSGGNPSSPGGLPDAGCPNGGGDAGSSGPSDPNDSGRACTTAGSHPVAPALLVFLVASIGLVRRRAPSVR